MLPAGSGAAGLITTEKADENVPVPQLLVPRTVRLPEVAVALKLMLTVVPVPAMLTPAPEYTHS